MIFFTFSLKKLYFTKFQLLYKIMSIFFRTSRKDVVSISKKMNTKKIIHVLLQNGSIQGEWFLEFE